jgi:hypothetical protein
LIVDYSSAPLNVLDLRVVSAFTFDFKDGIAVTTSMLSIRNVIVSKSFISVIQRF